MGEENKINFHELMRSNETLFFEKNKKEVIDFVSRNFLPTEEKYYYYDPEKLESTFYAFKINKEVFHFRHDKYLDCWMVYADNKIVFNYYNNPEKFEGKYINERGHLEDIYNYPYEKEYIDKFKKNYKILLDEIKKEYEKQKERGKVRKLKSRTHGHILVKDIENYWTKKLSSKEKMKFFEETKNQIVPEELDINDFYKICKVYYELANEKYKHNEYSFLTDATPKECYLKNSDGRYDSLDKVETRKDLVDWYEKEGDYKDRREGGHPFEIEKSGSIGFSTHIYIRLDEGKGYYAMTGYANNADLLIKTYLEATKQGLPVKLHKADRYIDALKGNGKARVTDNLFAFNYPDEDYLSHEYDGNLTKEEKKNVVWDEIKLSKINTKENKKTNNNVKEK